MDSYTACQHLYELLQRRPLDRQRVSAAVRTFIVLMENDPHGDDFQEDYPLPLEILQENGFPQECLNICLLVLTRCNCSQNKEYYHLMMGICLFDLGRYGEAVHELRIAHNDEDYWSEVDRYLNRIREIDPSLVD